MDYDAEGKEVLKCGFKIGGGIDQNYKKSPQGYTDNVGDDKCTLSLELFVSNCAFLLLLLFLPTFVHVPGVCVFGRLVRAYRVFM